MTHNNVKTYFCKFCKFVENQKGKSPLWIIQKLCYSRPKTCQVLRLSRTTFGLWIIGHKSQWHIQLTKPSNPPLHFSCCVRGRSVRPHCLLNGLVDIVLQQGLSGWCKPFLKLQCSHEHGSFNNCVMEAEWNHQYCSYIWPSRHTEYLDNKGLGKESDK